MREGAGLRSGRRKLFLSLSPYLVISATLWDTRGTSPNRWARNSSCRTVVLISISTRSIAIVGT